MTKHEKVNYSSFAILYLYFNLRPQIHKNEQTQNLQYIKGKKYYCISFMFKIMLDDEIVANIKSYLEF